MGKLTKAQKRDDIAWDIKSILMYKSSSLAERKLAENQLMLMHSIHSLEQRIEKLEKKS